MRLAYLVLRSRQAGRAVALLAVVVAATWLWRRVAAGDSLNTMLLIITPSLAAAAVIGTGTSSPLADLEATASRVLPPLRLGHLGGLLGLMALGLLAVGGGLDGALVRDLAGFTGLALLTARFAGSAASWTVPFGYGALAILVGAGQRWAWPSAEATDREAVLIAGALLILGVGVIAWSGAREQRDAAP